MEARAISGKSAEAGNIPINANKPGRNLANMYQDMGQYEKAELLYLDSQSHPGN